MQISRGDVNSPSWKDRWQAEWNWICHWNETVVAMEIRKWSRFRSEESHCRTFTSAISSFLLLVLFVICQERWNISTSFEFISNIQTLGELIGDIWKGRQWLEGYWPRCPSGRSVISTLAVASSDSPQCSLEFLQSIVQDESVSANHCSWATSNCPYSSQDSIVTSDLNSIHYPIMRWLSKMVFLVQSPAKLWSLASCLTWCCAASSIP